ncbi:centromere protein Q isoform X1 [Brachionichthys hirsutus]|uniref:centromere protein Q isoform X1 n=1 Tax=Brachionichthys hirsutus TaxID=412623 RepID=UPI003604A73A
MKPLRGSNRTPSKAPKLKNGKKSAAVGKTGETDPQKSDGRKKHQKAAQKRKTEGSPSVPKKAKRQENQKQIQRSSVILLENIMEWSMLETLALKRKVKKESQEHLNIVKNAFLAQCAQLKVPAQAKRYAESSSRGHRQESKKAAVGRSNLSNLQGNLRAVVSALENLAEQNEALQHSCVTLKNQVEEEEENAKEEMSDISWCELRIRDSAHLGGAMNEHLRCLSSLEILEIAGGAVLNLPPVPRPKDGITSAAQMRQLLPDSAAETTARKLGEILQETGAIRDAQALLLEAHQHADRVCAPLSD